MIFRQPSELKSGIGLFFRPEKAQVLCQHYLRGCCAYGDGCYKIHPKKDLVQGEASRNDKIKTESTIESKPELNSKPELKLQSEPEAEPEKPAKKKKARGKKKKLNDGSSSALTEVAEVSQDSEPLIGVEPEAPVDLGVDYSDDDFRDERLFLRLTRCFFLLKLDWAKASNLLGEC